jgi:hypothetical protein
VISRRTATSKSSHDWPLMLAPELDVLDVATSLPFYVRVPKLLVPIDRPAERFGYLARLGAE